MTMTAPLRVLVVDDSASNRRTLVDILAGSSDVEVVGKASDGEQALRIATSERPDVITLDLEMPRMDGFTFLRLLMAKQPTPVIVVSSNAQKDHVFRALELGAIDFIARPEGPISPEGAWPREVLQKVLLVRCLRVPGAPPPGTTIPRSLARRAIPDTGRVQLPPGLMANKSLGPVRYVIGIAASTGGPTALVDLFARLPDPFPGAVIVAQHMPDKFTRSFADRLDRKGTLGVTEAEDGDIVSAGRAYVCPGHSSVEVIKTPGFAPGSVGELQLRIVPPQASDRFTPSADRLFSSLASAAGKRAIGVVLTGMGDDGAQGVKAIREAGGTVIAEKESSAVVYGMPRAAVASGAVHDSLDLNGIAEFLSLLP